ncbi:MAG TPA: hypothetical protein VMX33_07805 [bacterium]|nr:hypothetical protein [bacterium]
MKVKLVLSGGIKTCCSVTSTEVVQKAVREWLPESDELVVIDREKQPWTAEGLAAFAERYFHDEVYPLLFIDDTLAMIGGLPSRKNLLAMTSGHEPFGLTENDIVTAAKSLGYTA